MAVLARPGVEVKCSWPGKVPNRLRQSAAGMIWFGDLCDTSLSVSCPPVVVVLPVGVVVPPVLLVGSDKTDLSESSGQAYSESWRIAVSVDSWEED